MYIISKNKILARIIKVENRTIYCDIVVGNEILHGLDDVKYEKIWFRRMIEESIILYVGGNSQIS